MSRSNAELADDVERLTFQLNIERFCFIVGCICFADGIVFTYYSSITAPVCLTLLEAGGLFVLARYLEIGEVVTLISEMIRRFGKKDVDRDSDPKTTDVDQPKTDPAAAPLNGPTPVAFTSPKGSLQSDSEAR